MQAKPGEENPSNGHASQTRKPLGSLQIDEFLACGFFIDLTGHFPFMIPL